VSRDVHPEQHPVVGRPILCVIAVFLHDIAELGRSLLRG
jgi:hypothetical protein